MTMKRVSLLIAFVLLLALPAAAESPKPHLRAASGLTPLDEYVAKPDDHFSFKLLDQAEGDWWRGYVLEMTSQQWLTEAEVSPTVWTHYVSILVPKDLKTTTGMLLIGGGSHRDDPPRPAGANLRRVAEATGGVAAAISNVPAQPLEFTGDEGRRRNEDAIIAYTWDKYLRTGDAKWPLRLPMTKAAVRALDTVQMFCASPEGGGIAVEKFIVAGGSKRGWTTWTTGIVDSRVVAIAPIVIDLLNLVPSFAHHWAVYGFWAPAIKDYTQLGIMEWLGSKEFDALMEIVEPYHYRDRLVMPKLLINAAGDQFFLPDSSQFYFDDLKGPSYLCYVPNVGHGAGGRDGMDSLLAFCNAISHDKDMPEFSWEFPDENTIRVTAKTKPAKVELWQATNPESRDFRVDVFGRNYKAAELKPIEPGVYEATVPNPPKGWTAYLIQLTFEGYGGKAMKLSTPVRMAPLATPHTWEWPESPKGFLSN